MAYTAIPSPTKVPTTITDVPSPTNVPDATVTDVPAKHSVGPAGTWVNESAANWTTS